MSASSMERLLCLVPARGGSRGVSRKNLRHVGGRPLLAWSVEHALALRETVPALDVVVSTEDDEIAEAALAAGAEVPFRRPHELATDESATEPVVRHAIEQMTARGRAPSHVMLLQPTSPVRLPGTLARAVDEYAATGVDSLVGVVAQSPFLWRPGESTGEGPDAPPVPSYDVAHRPRRQDLAPGDLRYRETGSVYLTRAELYLDGTGRIGGRVGLFVMDDVEGLDIDTEHDLAVAEVLLRKP